MRDIFISLVIPAYNEASIIESTVKSALEYLSGEFSQYELIIANDGSTDGTGDMVRSIDDSHLRIVEHFPNRGKGSAVREGALAARGQIVAYTDADLAYGLQVIGQMADKLEQSGSAAVIGSRRLHPDGYAEYPPLRLIASRCFGLVTGAIAGFGYDTQCGIKLFRGDVSREIFSRCTSDGFAFDFEVMMLCDALGGNRVEQFPVSIVNFRDSKVNVASDSIKMLRDVFRIKMRVKRLMREERGDEAE